MFYVINRPFLGGKRSGIKLYKLDEAIYPEQKTSTRNPGRQIDFTKPYVARPFDSIFLQSKSRA